MSNPARLTDAELTAMYGRGLHPDTAARVIDEVRALRAENANLRYFLSNCQTERIDNLRRAVAAEARQDAMEGDRDTWRHRAEVISGKLDTLRARLAEVEAERDDAQSLYRQAREMHKVYRARLAEVEALCDEARSGAFDSRVSFESAVRAAARGEGDR